MTEPQFRHQFREIIARDAEHIDLAQASLLIAGEEYPTLDVGHYLARIEELAARLASRVRDAHDPAEAASALSGLLFHEEGFRGNTNRYYDPRNSFLNDVLDRHTGIPISLSTVYMEVASRAGLAVDGVGLPGHFVVRVHAAGEGVLVDPFNGGSVLSRADCQDRLNRIYEGRVKLEEEMLAPCGRRDILARLLGNLKGIYLREEDYPRALRIVELLLLVEPDSVQELRDRGLVYAAMDCYGLAARDLAAYQERVPGSPEGPFLAKKIDEMRRKAARLN